MLFHQTKTWETKPFAKLTTVLGGGSRLPASDPAGGLSRKMLDASAELAGTQMVEEPPAVETTLNAKGEWAALWEGIEDAIAGGGCGEGEEEGTPSWRSAADRMMATGLAIGAGGGGGYIDVEK